MEEILVNSMRESIVDHRFNTNVLKLPFKNILFIRLVAKEKKFEKVDFKYSIFDAAYLRECSFLDCDFTGCRFINGNLTGSSFVGCKFDYATFQHTQIDNDVLDNSCPSWENLKLKFARSLRLNYQQLGDAKSANKAMNVELAATAEHHWKSWNSNESYYRKKYSGWKRVSAFANWLEFKLLDFIWGNGESLLKLARSFLASLIGVFILYVFLDDRPHTPHNYLDAIILTPSVFFGITHPDFFPDIWITFIYVLRLVLFAFFMAIMIKRFSRR